MRSRSGKSWRWRAPGVTLVETIAGTALLGTLLVSIVVAKGRLAVQSRRSENRIRACAVLNDLLEHRWGDPNELRGNESGEAPGHKGWRWRTRILANEDALAVHAKVVAVEVFAPDQDDSLPSASIEILLPEKRPKEDDETQRRNDID